MVYDRMDDRPAFTGIPTFLRVPALADVEALRADCGSACALTGA